MGRSTMSEQEMILFFEKISSRAKKEDDTFEYKQLKINGGLDHTKEYAEMALELIDQVVYHPVTPGKPNSPQ